MKMKMLVRKFQVSIKKLRETENVNERELLVLYIGTDHLTWDYLGLLVYSAQNNKENIGKICLYDRPLQSKSDFYKDLPKVCDWLSQA